MFEDKKGHFCPLLSRPIQTKNGLQKSHLILGIHLAKFCAILASIHKDDLMKMP